MHLASRTDFLEAAFQKITSQWKLSDAHEMDNLKAEYLHFDSCFEIHIFKLN